MSSQTLNDILASVAAVRVPTSACDSQSAHELLSIHSLALIHTSHYTPPTTTFRSQARLRRAQCRQAALRYDAALDDLELVLDAEPKNSSARKQLQAPTLGSG